MARTRKRQKSRLREDIYNTLNVGSVGMTGGVAWKAAGVARVAGTGQGMEGISKKDKPKFGDFRNLGF